MTEMDLDRQIRTFRIPTEEGAVVLEAAAQEEVDGEVTIRIIDQMDDQISVRDDVRIIQANP